MVGAFVLRVASGWVGCKATPPLKRLVQAEYVKDAKKDGYYRNDMNHPAEHPADDVHGFLAKLVM
jgi:hypothetical protein